MILAELNKHIEQKTMRPDAAQLELAQRLDALLKGLSKETGWKSKLAITETKPPQSLYIYGGVGRGKTWLMDVFFKHLSFAKKRRVHFHEFMIWVHDSLHAYRGDSMALDKVVSMVVRKYKILCLDEFYVRDIVSAMLCSRLFQALHQRGVAVVATSNDAPEQLYINGLQREQFLPFIAFIRKEWDVFSVSGEVDYRYISIAQEKRFYHPASNENKEKLKNIFLSLTAGKQVSKRQITVKARNLNFHASAKVVYCGFDMLFRQPLGAEDYLALCREFEIFILQGLPIIDTEEKDVLHRWMAFVDVIYDNDRRLYCQAEAALDLLLTGRHPKEYKRTLSRLKELLGQID